MNLIYKSTIYNYNTPMFPFELIQLVLKYINFNYDMVISNYNSQMFLFE